MSFNKTLSNDSSKNLPNKNIILAILGAVLLLVLILFFQYVNKPKIDEKSPYLLTDETDTSGQDKEPFSIMDIDGDGEKEQVPREIVESKILMRTSKGELYAINPVDKKKILLLEGISAYATSDDKNNIAYLKSCPLTGDASSCDRDIHIYNVRNKQELTITAGKSAQRTLSWSPDGRYIIVERGTGPQGSCEVYSLETNQFNGCSYSGGIFWISEKEILTPLYSSGYTPRPTIENTDAVGIKKINVETCQSESLLLPTNTADYSAVKFADNVLVVKKTYVDRPEDWVNAYKESKLKTTYEKYDLQTKTMTPYPEYENEIKSETERLEALVPHKSKLKSVFKTDKDIVTGWELINVYKGGPMHNNDVYLIGLDEIIVKIGEKASASWL